MHTCTEVSRGEGRDHLERLTLRDVATGDGEIVDTSWLFIFIGAEPRTDWLDGVVARDSRGFVLTGPDLVAGGRRPAGWNLDRTRSTWSGAFPASSPRATCEPIGEARRVRGRRGRDGGFIGAPISGGA